jgi:enoyl-CoA hydratase
MPETGIGLFPDVGGGWHLPRLAGQTGYWLALTGARIKAADCMALGLATHYVESAKLEALKADLIAASGPDQIASTLAAHETDPGPSPLDPQRAILDDCFSAPTVEAVMDRLERDESDWAKAQLTSLKIKSPQTLKVALRQLQTGAALTDFASNMVMEYRIGARVVQRHDFLEGVRAVIIDKDNDPKWSPTTLEAVDEALLDEIFAPLAADQEWTPLTIRNRA